jgi:hypothetical protein
VVSLASGGERHVVQKLGRHLGVQISEVEVAFGQAAEKEEAEQQPDGGKQGQGQPARRPMAKEQMQAQRQRRPSRESTVE